MKRARLVLSLLAVVLLCVAAGPAPTAAPSWSLNASLIEACSCPMFCQCYFNTEPATHAGDGMHKHHEHGRYCRANIGYHVNRGSYNGTKLDGAQFWMAGDLGADFSKGEADWAVITFDPSVTKAQRDAILAILAKVYPMKWKSFSVGQDRTVSWDAGKNLATARLDSGKAGEIVLGKFQGMTDDPVVIKNLRYVGAPRNDGFILMPNQVEAWRVGDKAFEFRGTAGFMITIDISSTDVM